MEGKEIMKRVVFIFCGLSCLTVAGFLIYGFRYVDEHLNWYIGYTIFACLVGMASLHFGLKDDS